MNTRNRFIDTMRYHPVDRVPYFEEGIRDDVLEAWKKQGLPENADLSTMFENDIREEIFPEMDPMPKLEKWPATVNELEKLKNRLNPSDTARLPENWEKKIEEWKKRDQATMFRVHRGLFLSMGIYEWNRFTEVMQLFMEDTALVRAIMEIQAEFSYELAQKILKDVRIDAAIFSEPIGGNNGPLISPDMYEEYALKSYLPVMELLRRNGVEIIIFRTFANARILIPKILKYGFDCLWACEVNTESMDYRDLRRAFGKDLRLIGGIDLDALRKGKEAIKREIEEKVPPLLEQGGYVPLADGRVRADVSFENYSYYRQLLKEATTSG